MTRPTRLLLLLVFLAILVRTAWLSDDALITLRSVLNATHGFGLTFNIDERVQTFTHPLWALLLTGLYLVVGNVYVTTFALSIATSLLVFWLVVGRAGSTWQAWLAVTTLLLSRAFVDFSTSGLENPLSNLLLAAFAGVATRSTAERRRLTALWTLASLLYLSRPDNVLFVLPTLVLASWRERHHPVAAMRRAATGLLPAFAWTAFSTFYYGFPFPNTAYAKLAHGVHPSEVHRQGLLYLVDSLDRDPISLTAVALAVAMGLGTRGTARGLALGMALYLGYIVSIGGDFMAGRFIATPVLLAVVILAWTATAERRTWITATVVLAVVGAASMQVPLFSDSRFNASFVKPSSIVDERAVYFPTYSLVLAERSSFREPVWPDAEDPRPPSRVLDTCGLMGASGLDFGPHVHLLDECALADPLLARLPSVFNTAWRPGHFRRLIPNGYSASVETGTNQIADRQLGLFYDRIRSITRGPLFSRSRFNDIWRMNRGVFDSLIDRRYYRHNGSIVPIEALGFVTPAGSTDGPTIRKIETPLAVTCDPEVGHRLMAIALDADDRYLVEFVLDNRIVASMRLGPIPEYRRRAGAASYIETLPAGATRDGFDTIIIAPISGNTFSVGHLLLDGDPATADDLARLVAARDEGG